MEGDCKVVLIRIGYPMQTKLVRHVGDMVFAIGCFLGELWR